MLRPIAALTLPLSLVLACASASREPSAAPQTNESAAPKSVPATQPAPPAVPNPQPTPIPPVEPNAALAYDDDDPLANLEAADALDRAAGRGKAAPIQPPPTNGCALAGNAVRLWPRPGPVAIAAMGNEFALAGYDTHEGRERVYAVQWDARTPPKPIATLPFDTVHKRKRIAPPGIAARDADEVAIAYVDGAGVLRVAQVRAGGGTTVEVAQGVDTRFAPAVARVGTRTLIAWTEGSTPMRTHLAVLGGTGAIEARHDVTPQAMGLAAPTFVAGAHPPVLVGLDARQGTSPVVRVDLADDGTPRPGEVALAVGTAPSPPELAAGSSAQGTWLAYTAIGNAAASAVGHVRLAPVPNTPSPLVAPTAYGQLHVSAVAGPKRVIFAAEAPTEAGKDPPHRIVVYAVGADELGPALALEVEGGALHASLARNERGEIAVAYASPSGVFAQPIDCDD